MATDIKARPVVIGRRDGGRLVDRLVAKIGSHCGQSADSKRHDRKASEKSLIHDNTASALGEQRPVRLWCYWALNALASSLDSGAADESRRDVSRQPHKEAKLPIGLPTPARYDEKTPAKRPGLFPGTCGQISTWLPQAPPSRTDSSHLRGRRSR